jgi:hypothetical protein
MVPLALTLAGPLLVVTTSATGVMVVLTVDVLFADVGSVRPAGEVIVVELATAPDVVAVPCTITVHVPLLGHVATVPLTALPATDEVQVVPALGVVLTIVTPVRFAGTLSVNVAPLAASGPALVKIN